MSICKVIFAKVDFFALMLLIVNQWATRMLILLGFLHAECRMKYDYPSLKGELR